MHTIKDYLVKIKKAHIQSATHIIEVNNKINYLIKILSYKNNHEDVKIFLNFLKDKEIFEYFVLIYSYLLNDNYYENFAKKKIQNTIDKEKKTEDQSEGLALVLLSAFIIKILIKIKAYDPITPIKYVNSSEFINELFLLIEKFNIFYNNDNLTKIETNSTKKYILKNMDSLVNKKIIFEKIINEGKKTNKF
jgi:hypothetical protein